MKPWTERPREEASLFNPSFCGLVVWHVATGYGDERREPLPLELSFLAFPIALHKPTRDILPSAIRTSMAMWLERNVQVRVGLAERARALVPFGREGLLFGTVHGLLEIGRDGAVAPSTKPQALIQYLSESTADVQETLKKAHFVGRWFAGAGTVATVMALWGVRP